jgi:hypothetical protein
MGHEAGVSGKYGWVRRSRVSEESTRGAGDVSVERYRLINRTKNVRKRSIII